MKMKRVKCKSGITGTQCRLQDNYDSFEDWEHYATLYNLHLRLDFHTIKGAWDANPIIQYSVNPSDYCRVFIPPIKLSVKRKVYLIKMARAASHQASIEKAEYGQDMLSLKGAKEFVEKYLKENEF